MKYVELHVSVHQHGMLVMCYVKKWVHIEQRHGKYIVMAMQRLKYWKSSHEKY
jgi:hypothetical protein